ncbi:MAG TPA: hypothetical protein DDW65_00200 [Firmicutes bacterium]|jgi:hypothetical protein|nr:hypothetical protein [Bacillota bacterium]
MNLVDETRKKKIIHSAVLAISLTLGSFGVADAEETAFSSLTSTINIQQSQDNRNEKSPGKDSQTKGDSKSDRVPVTEVEVNDSKNQKGEAESSQTQTPDSTSAVETFTAEDIEAMRPNDVYDVIESAMGMDIARQGARIHNFTTARGGDVAIIVDGVYVTKTMAQRVLGDIPVSMIQSIKIIRDSTVLTLSPMGAFGSTSGGASDQGAIIITTKKAAGKGKDIEANIGYSSYNTQKIGVFAGTKIQDRVDLGFGYAKSKSDGKDGWNMGYDFNSFLFKGGYTDKSWIVNSSLYINNGWREIQRHFDSTVTSYNTTSIPEWKYDPMNSMIFALNIVKPWNVNDITTFSFGRTKDEGTQYGNIYNATTDVWTLAAGKDAEDRANEVNLFHTMHLGFNTLKIGTQIIGSYQLTEGNTTAAEDEIYGYYIIDENRLNEKLSLDGGIRFDKRHITEGTEKYLADGNKVKGVDDKWTDDTYGISLGANYQINQTYSILPRIGYNHTPTPEIWTTVNNEELPAEKRMKYELGFLAGYSKAFNTTLTAFYYDVKDAKTAAGTVKIVEDGTTYSINKYGLVDEVERSGLELSLDGQIIAGLKYKFGYTYYTSSSASEDVAAPDNKYSLQLNYKNKSLGAGISALKVDPYEYSNTGVTVGDFTVININLDKYFSPDIKISLFGRNVTDKHYATMYKSSSQVQEWGFLYDVGAVYGIELTKKF